MVRGWALQGPEQQERVTQPLKTQSRTKLGSAEPRHLGERNNRGVHTKMPRAVWGGGGFTLLAPSCSFGTYQVKFTQLLTEHR